MDSPARLILRGLLVVLLGLLGLRHAMAVEYTGPDNDPGIRLRCNANMGAPCPQGTERTVGEANVAYGCTSGAGQSCGVCVANGSGYYYPSDASIQELVLPVALWYCQGAAPAITNWHGGWYSAVYVCPGELLTGTAPNQRCKSRCFPQLNVTVQASVAVTSGLDPVSRVCLLSSNGICAYEPGDTTIMTFAGLQYRMGGWLGHGVTCEEHEPPIERIGTVGLPTSGGSGSGGLDATDKANLAATATNTGSEGAIGTKLDAIKTALSPTVSQSSGTVNCSQPYNCTGDAARCQELVMQRDLYCQSVPTDTAVEAVAISNAEALLSMEAPALRESLKKPNVDISSGVNRPRFLAAGSCPAPVSQTLTFGPITKTFSVGFQAFCDLANIIAVFVVTGASVIGVRIFLGGLG